MWHDVARNWTVFDWRQKAFMHYACIFTRYALEIICAGTEDDIWAATFPMCLLACCAEQHNVSIMIVVAGALINEQGQILLSQRKLSQSFSGRPCPWAGTVILSDLSLV